MADRKLRILLVEDVLTDAELEVRELRRAGLRIEHFIVDTEPNFRSALREFNPELIISDFSMPHFDGMLALDLARELAPEIPFIFVSGTIGEEYAIRALRNGATDYVLKTNLVRLPAAVERALQEARERSAYRKAQNVLRESEERFRSFMQHLPGRASIRDLEGHYTFVNESWRQAFRMDEAKVLGRKPDEILPPQRAEALKSIHDGVIEANKPLQRIFRTDTEGDARWWHSTHFPIRDVHGNAALIGTVAFDITEQKLQQEKIARLNRVYAVLSGINTLIVRVRDRQALFEGACRIAVQHGNFGIAWIGTLDPQTLDIIPVAHAGLEANEQLANFKSSASETHPLGQGVVGRAIRDRKPSFINDLLTEPSGGERRKEALRRGYCSRIALPLLVEDTVVGVMVLFAAERNFFSEEELKLLDELAGDVSFALEHIGKQQKLAKLARIRSISIETNAAITRIHDSDALLRETCRIATDHGKFELVWVGMVDEARQEIRASAWKGFSDETAHAVSWRSITAAGGTLQEATQNRRPSVRNDIGSELPRGGMRREALARDCRSTVCLPLIVDDRVVALIVLFATGRGFFDTDELALLNEFAADVSLALQSIARQERLNYLAYYDVLTGLPNRALFLEHVSHALHAAEHASGQLVLVLGDVKRFRMINDTLGRQAGDEVLKQVTQRLLQRIRNPENLARVAADHFATFLSDVKDLAEVSHRIENLVTEALREPIKVSGRELNLSFTVGISVYPHDGTDAETLFRNAEAALKNAKMAGERYLFYQPQMNARVAETLQLETKLRQALDREEFVLHYQPKVSLARGTISGLEALIRWNDPESGLVPPAKFISLLEETGMILEAGRWALRKAVADYREWHTRGLQPPRIAVNVSPIQLRQKDFVEVVYDVIAKAGGSHGLDLEITESLIMEDIDGNIEKLRAVRSMGVDIAIDDFGTGYSSLGYLAKLPVNALKIDRSFIITMTGTADSMTIVSTIISLAHALNLKVIAEGVDAEEQRNFLRLLKCDEMQGYLFSRPVPASGVEVLLAAGRNGKPASTAP